MKKITLLINSLTSGGAEKVLSLLITELNRQHYEVTLISIEKESFYMVPDGVERLYLSSLKTDDSAIKKLLYLPLLAWRLKRYIKESGVTLIQSHMYRANYINILAKIFGAKHTVQVVEVTNINSFKLPLLTKKINLKLIEWLYPHIDLIVFLAERMKLDFFQHLPLDKPFAVINNPYDIEKIERLCGEEIDNFSFEDEKRYLVTVGRLDRQKNQQGIIEILNELDSSVELLVVGDGVLKEDLERKVDELNLKDRVHLLGNQRNPFKYIRHSDIFILNSREEGFPNVLVEAMLCGTAVISTDCISGPREILAPKSDILFQLKEGYEEAENGLLTPVDDGESLVQAINRLLSDPLLKEAYEVKAKEDAKNYSLEKIIEKYKDVLECVE